MTRSNPEAPRPAGSSQTNEARRDGIPDRTFALAWARLAGTVAPPHVARPERVLVLRAVSLYGGG